MDVYGKVNPVLRAIMQNVYQERKALPSDILTSVRTETVNDKSFCEVWFITKGCSHDAKGGCTMCNYGKGCQIEEKRVLDELKLRLAELPSELEELIVTPTGSMLDDEEVPVSMRKSIFALLKDTESENFYIETRVDSITDEKLKHLKESVNARNIHIEVGVECTNDWVLRNLVNKNLTFQEIKKCVSIIHNIDMFVCGNVGIGIPFLNERTNIALAVNSVRELLDIGFDSVVIFPYHVKPGTLSYWLWKRGLYECCSLWGIPDVLNHFNRDELKKIHISWYRNYYSDKKKIVSSPSVDANDMERLLSLLDGYKNHPGTEALDALMKFESIDRVKWREKLMRENKSLDLEKIKNLYYLLSKEFGIPSEQMNVEWESMKLSWEEQKYVFD